MTGQDLSTPREKHARLMLDLELIHDLMGGTRAMRAAGLKWLPREQAETWEAWRQRLDRSTLFNGMVRSWQAMIGQLIPGEVTLEGGDARLAAIAENIDGKGGGLTAFAGRMAELLLRDGAVYVLVDAPAGDDGGRPYFVMIEAAQMLGMHENNGGIEMVRLREQNETRTSRFGFTTSDRIRVFEKNNSDDDAGGNVAWSLWEEDSETRQWGELRSGAMEINRIPFVAAEMNATLGRWIRPPLLDLAWLNLAHWQSASDQRHILHIARVPILFARGMNSHDGPVDIGPNRLIVADDPAADIKFVEHSGAAIEAGRQDLIDLEEKMAMLGLDMLREHNGHPTATGKIIDDAQSNATLALIRARLTDSLNACFALAAEWLGLEAGAAGRVILPDATAPMLQRMQDADLLMKARQSGDISKDHFLNEIERRGILAPAPAPAADN